VTHDAHHHDAHHHDTHHHPASARHRGRLVVALALLLALAAVEVTVGLTGRSLALLSDAGHVVVDVLGLAMTLATVSAAARPSRSAHRTFGLYRAEVVGTLANAVLLGAVAVWVLLEAVQRLRHPAAVAAVPLTVTATVGLLVNLGAYALLHRGAGVALSLRAASSEVLADAAAALGALTAGVLTWTTGWRYADPVIAAGIAVLILPRAVGLARAALRVLLEAAPAGVDVPGVADGLARLPGVLGVHDLHLWTLTSGMEAATAHLTVRDGTDPATVLSAARTLLAVHGVAHATVQLEPVGRAGCCHDASW